MESRSRLVVIALVAVLAVVGGFAAGALLTGNRGSPAGTPTGEAQVSESPSEIASEEPSAETVEPESESPEPTDEETPEATESASPAAAAPTASITFARLMLDAADNPDGADRILTWNSATGSVKADVRSVTPSGNVRMCLSTPDKELGCRTAGSGTLSAKTTKSRETFILTLRGEGTSQPAVDVALTFPARKPKVAIENARFDGTAYPDTNGIQARFDARGSGDAHLVADWGGHPFLYEVDLFDETGGSGNATLANQGPSTNVDEAFPVTAGTWRLVLQNIEDGLGTTDLTATISWP